MNDEFNALLKNKTWQLVTREHSMHVIGCKWIYSIKYTAAGEVDRYKARLAAKGFSQENGYDFSETFSPVVKITTIRLLLSLAIGQNWLIHQLDVSNAFLHGELKEIIYMEQPPGYQHPNHPNVVCKLQKSLYGLKQAPREWFKKLTTFLLSNGFQDSNTDTSFFFQNLKIRINFSSHLCR